MKRTTALALAAVLLCCAQAAAKERFKGLEYKGQWRSRRWVKSKYRDHHDEMTKFREHYYDTQRRPDFKVQGTVREILSLDEMIIECPGVYKRSTGERLTRRIRIRGCDTARLREKTKITSIKVYLMGDYTFTSKSGHKTTYSDCYAAAKISLDDFVEALQAGFELVRWVEEEDPETEEKVWVKYPDY